MKLRDLEIGDRFISAASPNKRTAITYRVFGKCEFNIQAGTATRKCFNQKTNQIENKQCRIEVIKLEGK